MQIQFDGNHGEILTDGQDLCVSPPDASHQCFQITVIGPKGGLAVGREGGTYAAIKQFVYPLFTMSGPDLMECKWNRKKGSCFNSNRIQPALQRLDMVDNVPRLTGDVRSRRRLLTVVDRWIGRVAHDLLQHTQAKTLNSTCWLAAFQSTKWANAGVKHR